MEFYSFRLGEMKVAQADAASPKTMAVEMTLGFRAPEQHTVETIELTVHVPHDPDKTVSAAEGGRLSHGATAAAGRSRSLRVAGRQAALRGDRTKQGLRDRHVKLGRPT